MRRIGILCAALVAILASPLAAQPEFPELTGRVVDNAEIISPEVEAQLSTQLETLETETQTQLVIVTLPELQGYDIADFGYQLGRELGLGDATRNDGALLIVAPNDRKVRIEVGYGLEGVLTDAYASQIIQRDIVPRFREDDFGGGISLGVEGIADDILKVGAAAAPADTADTSVGAGEASTEGGGNILIWIGGIFAAIIAFFVAMGRRARAKLAATPCSACGKTGLTRERVTVEEATTERAGKGEIRTICPHCGHVEVETYSISKLAKSKPAEKEKPKSSGGASGEW